MAYLDINLNDGETDFAPLPEGMYRVRIDDSELEYSRSERNVGKPMYKWKLVVISPEEMKDPLSGEVMKTAGRLLFRRTPAWDGAMGFLRDLVRAAGGVMSSMGFDSADIHGKEMDVYVTQSEYKGRLTNNCDRFYAPAEPLKHSNPRKAVPPPRPQKEESEDDLPASWDDGSKPPF